MVWYDKRNGVTHVTVYFVISDLALREVPSALINVRQRGMGWGGVKFDFHGEEEGGGGGGVIENNFIMVPCVYLRVYQPCMLNCRHCFGTAAIDRTIGHDMVWHGITWRQRQGREEPWERSNETNRETTKKKQPGPNKRVIKIELTRSRWMPPFFKSSGNLKNIKI